MEFIKSTIKEPGPNTG